MKINKHVNFTLHIFLIVLVPLTLAYAFTIFEQQQRLEDITLGNLRTIASMQESRIEQIVQQNLERLSLIVSRTEIRTSLNEYNNTGNAEVLERVNKNLRDAKDSIDDFKTLSIVNEDGIIIASTKPNQIGSDVSNQRYFIVGRNSPHIGTEIIDGEEEFILAAPFLLEDQYIGTLIAEEQMETLISVTRHHIALGETAEILIAEETEQGSSRLIVQPRFFDHPNARTLIEADEISAPLVEALKKNETLLPDAIDYRGKEVLAVTRYIPEAHWGIVVKIDKEEAFRSAHLLQLTEIDMFGATVIFILFALGTYTRNIEPSKKKKL